MTIVTKSNRDTYLRTKNRFYQAGWLDAERDEDPQVYPENAKAGSIEDSYVSGYRESMSNYMAMAGWDAEVVKEYASQVCFASSMEGLLNDSLEKC